MKGLTIGDRIKQRREELGLTQLELAERIGYKSKTSINKIELGVQNLKQSKIKAIADALNTTPSFIMGWRDDPESTAPLPDNIIPIETRKYPLLGEVACGVPRYADEHIELYIEHGTKIQADFCVRAKGDSMINAGIHDGDIVFVRKQPTVDNHDVAVVLIGDEATLKRVFYYPEQQKLILQAENPDYEPFVYVGEELQNVQILGKAVAYQSDVK